MGVQGQPERMARAPSLCVFSRAAAVQARDGLPAAIRVIACCMCAHLAALFGPQSLPSAPSHHPHPPIPHPP